MLERNRLVQGVLGAGLFVVLAAPAGAQAVCTPGPCTAPGAVPTVTAPLVVEAPESSALPGAGDVLSRPARSSASVVPAAAAGVGATALFVTLSTIARRRRAVGSPPAPPAPASPPVRGPGRVPSHRGVLVKDSRWDIAAVERAAAGRDHRP